MNTRGQPLQRAIGLLPMLLFMATSAHSGEPFKAGLAKRLLPDDLTAISGSAAQAGGEPWALFGWQGMTVPLVHYLDAFLTPVTATKRVRRGRVLHLQCSPREFQTPCADWRTERVPGDYVQVAEGSDFGSELAVRSDDERPIRVIGAFTDHELETLVDYLRSRPTLPPKGDMEMPGLFSTDPIFSIEQRSNGLVSVDFSGDLRSGMIAEVHRTSAGWQLVGVSGWVA